MSGEVSRSRQKKATNSAGAGGAKNQKNQAANLKYAAKKKSKERQKMLEKQKLAKSSCFGSLTFWTFVALIGLSYGAYSTHPEKFKEVYDQLPPQVLKVSHNFEHFEQDLPVTYVQCENLIFFSAKKFLAVHSVFK